MTTELSETALAELVCTRLSHDIIGNIGAVSNAVELLEEGDTDFMDDIRSILKTGSEVLSARLKFFRLTFGLSNANLEKIELLQKTAADYLVTLGSRNYPIKLDFALTDVKYARCALLAIMVLADTMIRGGSIKVALVQGRWAVVSEPEVPAPEEKISRIKNILDGKIELDAQFAPLLYLLKYLKQSNINLYVLKSPALGFVFE